MYLSTSHGVFPLVYHTLKEFQNIIPKDTFQKIKSINMDIVKQNMMMTSELLKVMKLLEENDIEAISFKGPVLAQMAYGDITLRQYVDLDILVDEKDVEQSIKMLLDNDYKNILPLEIIKNEICLDVIKDFAIENVKSGVLIELHWRLFEKRYLSNFDIFEHTNKKSILNGKKINTLSNEINLIYLCLHGSKHMWERIEWIYDIDRLLKNETYNWDKFISLSLMSNTKNAIFLGLYLSNSFFDTKIDDKIKYYVETEENIKLSYYVFNNMKNNIILKDEFKKNKLIFSFQKKLYNKEIDKIKFVLNSFFKISEEDCQTYYIDKRFSFIYIILRPYRLISKYLKEIFF